MGYSSTFKTDSSISSSSRTTLKIKTHWPGHIVSVREGTGTDSNLCKLCWKGHCCVDKDHVKAMYPSSGGKGPGTVVWNHHQLSPPIWFSAIEQPNYPSPKKVHLILKPSLVHTVPSLEMHMRYCAGKNPSELHMETLGSR